MPTVRRHCGRGHPKRSARLSVWLWDPRGTQVGQTQKPGSVCYRCMGEEDVVGPGRCVLSPGETGSILCTQPPQPDSHCPEERWHVLHQHQEQRSACDCTRRLLGATQEKPRVSQSQLQPRPPLTGPDTRREGQHLRALRNNLELRNRRNQGH